MTVRDRRLLLLCLLIIGFAALVTALYFNQEKQTYKPGITVQYDRVVSMAKALYKQKKQLGIDFTNGPCLTNDLLPGWVVDTVHNPRLAVDDEPQNECEAYLKGTARHFVELDLNGNVVRVQ